MAKTETEGGGVYHCWELGTVEAFFSTPDSSNEAGLVGLWLVVGRVVRDRAEVVLTAWSWMACRSYTAAVLPGPACPQLALPNDAG